MWWVHSIWPCHTLERRLAQKVDLLCDWLYDGKATLKKVVVVFEERDGALSVFRLDSFVLGHGAKGFVAPFIAYDSR